MSTPSEFKDGQLDGFHRHGFVVLDRKFSADMLAALNGELMELLTDDAIVRGRTNSNNGVQANVITADLQRVAGAGGRYPAFSAFINDEQIRALTLGYLARILGAEDTVESVQLHEQIDLEINSRTGKTNNSAWHFDRVPSIKCAVFLSDVDKRSGAFAAIPGSHFVTRKIALRHLTRNPDPLFVDNYVALAAETDSTYFEVAAGTAVLFDTMVIHKGGEITDVHERRTFRAVTWPPSLNRAYLSAAAPERSSLDEVPLVTYHPFDRSNQAIKDPRHLFVG